MKWCLGTPGSEDQEPRAELEGSPQRTRSAFEPKRTSAGCREEDVVGEGGLRLDAPLNSSPKSQGLVLSRERKLGNETQRLP